MAQFRSVLLIIAVLAALPILAAAQFDDDEVINVDSSMVVLNAAVFDGSGRALRGLQQQQFKIFEDGREQEISFFAAEETPFAAAILIDTSGSMEERVTLARSAAIRFLDGLRPDDNVAIYRFDSKVSLVQPFSNRRDLSEHIFDMKSEGMTSMNDAIFQAAADLEVRPEKRKAIVVLSDGHDTSSGVSASKALKAALAANVVIYTVDMSIPSGSGAMRVMNQGALKNFAEKTGGTFVATPGGAALRDAFKTIVDELGVQYTLGYQPSNTKLDGKWRAIELRISRPGLTIRTRKGYNAEKRK